MKVLCPYCGHHQKEGEEQCESCHGLFEPLSRTASQIAMGPWYVRNEDKPFLPGFSLALLRRLVAGGKITLDSVVRGPGTHQLWTRARYAHGVAHLLGVCHACGGEVDPRVKMCANCAATLPVGGDRDTLGLPTMPTQQAVGERLKLNGSLCPICASDAVADGRCNACDRVFSPVDRATRVTLGPWQLRDSKLPFGTGMSWVQLKQKIEAGEVSGDAIVRGPTTHQFFSVVRHTPDIAHLAGRCFQCASNVKPTDKACGNCGTSFAPSTPPDKLGLMFATDADAAAAQKRLDAQIAAINDPEIQKPVPAATPKSAPAQPQPPTPVPAPTPPAGVPSGTPEPTAPLASTPEPPQPADAPVFESAAPPPKARSRHAAASQKKTNPVVFVFTGLITLIAFGSIFYVISQNASKPIDGEAVVEPPPEQPDPTYGDETANPAQTRNYNELVNRLQRLQEIEQTPRIKPLVDAVEKQFTVVDKLWKAGKITLATQQFPSVLDKLKPAEEVVRARETALVYKEDAAKLRAEAEDEDAPEIAPRQFDGAEKLVSEASGAFDKEEYEDAETKWGKAVEMYKLSMAYVKAEEKAASLRRRFDKDLVKVFTLQQIEAGGGSLLAEARKKIAAGEKLYDDGDYPDAVASYTEAHELIPPIELAVKRAIGVHYWAINTGYHAADMLLKRAAGEKIAEKNREDYAFCVNNLGLGTALADAVPGGDEPDFAALAKVVVEDTAAQIVSRRGADIEVSFKLGLQLRIFQQMLATDGDLLTLHDDSKIRTTLTLLYKEAKDASYPQSFIDRLDAIKAMLNVKPKFEAVRQARVAWAKLREDLGEFEKAMSLIPMSTSADAKNPEFFTPSAE